MVDRICSADDFDGLLLPGGTDIDPMLYGQPNTTSMTPDRDMDALQMQMLDLFVHARKPVFGVCRGLQLINVYFGGTLHQNIATAKEHWGPAKVTDDQIHTSWAVKGSWLEKLYGERFCVNSHHHQAIDRVGNSLECIQFADDGVVEGICHTTLPIYAVQWHPERISLEMARTDVADGILTFKYFLMNVDEYESRKWQKVPLKSSGTPNKSQLAPIRAPDLTGVPLNTK